VRGKRSVITPTGPTSAFGTAAAVAMRFEYAPGATPIDPDEAAGFISAHLTIQRELNVPLVWVLVPFNRGVPAVLH
jgi:hypothetical protein